MLKAQVGAATNSESRMLLKTIRATDAAWLILLTDLLTTDLDGPGWSWTRHPPVALVSGPF
jgi:hypothetical protein